MGRDLRAVIVGASGYTGRELVKLCLGHPGIELAGVTSRQLAGVDVEEFLGLEAGGIQFENVELRELSARGDIFFLALPHGTSAEFGPELVKKGKTVFDLSADFRLNDKAVYKEFYKKDHPAPELLGKAVYGLPEIYREEIRKADLVACPGCYPTSVLLAVEPLLKEGLVEGRQIIVNSQSGVSGAGQKVERDFIFCECNENLRAYGIPGHRHTPEMEQELAKAAGYDLKITFIPHLAPVNRGMLTTVTAPFLGKTAEEAQNALETVYENSPFVKILKQSGDLPRTNRVIHSNKAEIACRLDKRTGRLIIISAIDNLGKGAAGQAVQSFNIRFGFEETAGLQT